MAKVKTIEDYKEEIKELAKESKSISRKMSSRRKKITALKTKQDLEFESVINWGKPEEITKAQWQHILHHWQDSTEHHYKISSDYIYSFGVHTDGIGGGEFAKNIQQHHLSIHDHHDVDKYKAFYFMVKFALKFYKSPKDDEIIYDITLLVNMFRKDWLHNGHHLEIRKSDDKCRFIDSYSTRDKAGDWMDMDKALDLIKKYQKIEIDDDDSCF